MSNSRLDSNPYFVNNMIDDYIQTILAIVSFAHLARSELKGEAYVCKKMEPSKPAKELGDEAARKTGGLGSVPAS
jgi:hypothetical protein